MWYVSALNGYHLSSGALHLDNNLLVSPATFYRAKLQSICDREVPLCLLVSISHFDSMNNVQYGPILKLLGSFPPSSLTKRADVAQLCGACLRQTTSPVGISAFSKFRRPKFWSKTYTTNMSPTPGPVKQLWYSWKKLRFPWRRRWLVGT